MTTYTTPVPATNPQLAPFRPPATSSDLAAMDAGELVAAHLDGNSQAFGELVRRYRVRLLNFIYR
ncbi:MAG: hypothetical protein ACRDHF_18720, partial [Tepidiformaceae bacterium]